MAEGCRSAQSAALRALVISKLDDKSRMSREAHVRFCESVAVKFRRATRPAVESFFGSLKCERVLWRSYQTRGEARADIVEYITMFYNSQRLHSYLDYQSPDQFERNGQVADAA